MSPCLHDLSDLPLMSALPEAARAELVAGALSRISAGEYLFRQGEAGDRAWLILSGVLLLEHTHPLAAEPVILGLCSRGELLGEVGLLQGGARTASGRALTDLDVLELDEACFDRLLREHAAFGRAIAMGLAGRLASTNRRLPGGPARIVALVGTPPTVAEGLAATLARQTARLVAVTSWPDARGLPRRLGVEASGRSALLHPRGFHVLVHRSEPDAEGLDELLDSLRQRYAFALLCLDGWRAEVGDRLTDDEPIVVLDEPPPDCRQPTLRLGASADADLTVPLQSGTERFERAMSELARRVQRTLPLTLRWPSPPDEAERARAEALLAGALGGNSARWRDDGLALHAWISSGELPGALDALLVPLTTLCPDARLSALGQPLSYSVARRL